MCQWPISSGPLCLYFVLDTLYLLRTRHKLQSSNPARIVMKSSLSNESLTDLTERLRAVNEEFTSHYPGETGRRQPVHTVYGGAHLFKSDSASRLGSLARRSLDQFAPD